jgi:class 3 adenylate cyclase
LLRIVSANWNGIINPGVDRLITIQGIGEQVRTLCGALFAAARELDPPAVEQIDNSEGFDPEVLLGLTFTELKRHEDPARLLAMICRLLIRLGDADSLALVLKLSHKIHDLELDRGSDSLLPDLYRGISQIGLGETKIGTKNLLAGLSPVRRTPILPPDRCLGYWALVSAAIVDRNLRLALRYADQWLKTAKESAENEQIFCAKAAMHILHLLLADAAWCSSNFKEIASAVPEERREAVRFLEKWTEMLSNGRETQFEDFPEPLPLLLSLDWHFCGPLPDDISSADFKLLCNLVRRLNNKSAMRKHLTAEQVVDFAGLLAKWELSGQLGDAEAVLKETDVDRYLEFNLARVLGRHALEYAANAQPSRPVLRTLPDAVIWIMDVRDFSRFSEDYPPESLFEILGPLFKIMHEELESAGGTIHEFVGDSIVVVFNTREDWRPDILDILSHTVRAIQRIHILNSLDLPAGMPELRIGVGINKGPVATGYLGGLSRCHLSVLGNTVNVAARMEQATKQAPDSVLVSKAFFEDREPDVWSTPLKVNFSLREAGRVQMKNISNIPHLYSIKPLLNYWVDFVPMGHLAGPQRGVVYIDTGNSAQLGTIDHHHPGTHEAGSACELLIRKPQLLLGHLQGVPSSQIEFRLHEQPDLDCAATFYSACELMEKEPRQDILKLLAEYVSKIDRGMIPRPETVADSLYGVFLAHQKFVEDEFGLRTTDAMRLEAGLRVIDCAFYLMEKSRLHGDFTDIFRFGPGWFRQERQMIRNDRSLYDEDREFRGHCYKARLRGLPVPVEGLWLDHPISLLFKFWARSDRRAEGGRGYAFLSVDWSEVDKRKNRFVISVPPEADVSLKGLGELLEKEESARRNELGLQRPVQPIRRPSDNSDPWYFGWSHDYTIVDSPRNGTVLTGEEVQRIHKSWLPQ